MCSPPTFCFVQTLKSAHHHSTNKSITTPSFDEITYLLQGNILNEYRIYVRLLHFKLHKSVLFTYKRCRVKCTLVQALRLCTGRTAHRGSRGIALPFLDHGTRRGWGGQSHALVILYPRERPGTHCTEGWVGPRLSYKRHGAPIYSDSRNIKIVFDY